jgi:hypothetical protein
MKTINTDNLERWLKGEEIDDFPYFIVIKTPGCIKCNRLLMNRKISEKEDWFDIFIFTSQDKKGAEIMNSLSISSVPVILFRYKIERKNFYKYVTRVVMPNMNDLIEFENILDAIYSKDTKYFGVDEYGELIEGDISEEDSAYVSLIYEIYGEPDNSEREKFKNAIN